MGFDIHKSSVFEFVGVKRPVPKDALKKTFDFSYISSINDARSPQNLYYKPADNQKVGNTKKHLLNISRAAGQPQHPDKLRPHITRPSSGLITYKQSFSNKMDTLKFFSVHFLFPSSCPNGYAPKIFVRTFG